MLWLTILAGVVFLLLVLNATGPGYPGGGNTYVPPDFSDKLRMGFSRNPKKFHLPKYVEYVESPNDTAYYLKITSADATRIINTQDFAWPDGQIDPDPDTGTESFNFIPFRCKRNRYGFKIGDVASQQAAWPIIDQHSQNVCSKLMTNRTIRMATTATNPASWTIAGSDDNAANLAYDHTGTPQDISLGFLDQGTPSTPYIQQQFSYVADIINQDTQGVVDSDPKNQFAIMNPRTARQLAASPEIHAYMQGSVHSKSQMEEGAGGQYALPPILYGMTVIVDNAVRTTSPRGAALVRSYPVPNRTIIIASRVGGLEGAYGAPSFSTLTMFWWKYEMTIQTKHDDWNQLTRGRAVEMTFEAVTCSASGYLITSCTSS